MADQEISLFHDSNPMLTIPELERNLPCADDLWLAPDASTWAHSWQELYGSGPGSDFQRPSSSEPPGQSLPQLFQSLLENKLDHGEVRLQILHLRLLLYPMHILIAQLSELTLCLPEKPIVRFGRSTCQTSSSLRFDEIKNLLRTWWKIFHTLQAQTARQSALRQSTEIIYHLLNLGLAVSFTHLEQYSREFQTRPEPRDVSHLIATGVLNVQEAIFHCGQILRIIRGMEIELRPLWWPAALYRVTVILWTLSISRTIGAPQSLSGSLHSSDIAIDTLAPDDQVWQPFLKYNRGRPCLTAAAGGLCPLVDSETVLHICMCLLRQYSARSYLAESLLVKLEALLEP